MAEDPTPGQRPNDAVETRDRAEPPRHGDAGRGSLRPAQRRAVEAPGDVAVVAGAGTGKTHMLAHRYLTHVEDGLDPLEIVAVTFTERAASELRSRVRDLLNASLPSGSPARLTVEAAQISTMHALAQRICREFPEQAGVAPDFTILDDLEGGVWLAERIESALGAAPAELFAAAPYRAVRETLTALVGDPLTADEAFAVGSSRWPALVAEARTRALDDLTSAPAWRESAALVRGTAGAEGDRREATRREAVAALARLSEGEVDEGLAALAALSLVGGSRRAFADGEFTVLGDAIKHLRDTTRRALSTGLIDLALGEADERLADLLPLLRSAYLEVRGRLEEEKLQRRVLDFSDLEVHASRALADPSVVAFYQSRWRALLVDEFQDTNAVQERILDELAGSMTVTVVGDEKQSIYGFRGARTEVFGRYRDRVLKRGGSEVVLAESFRAHAGLMVDVNATFAPLLGDQHQPLTAVRPALPGRERFMTLAVIAGGGGRAKTQLSEARALATTITELVDSGAVVHDKATGALRPVRFSDIAVLARGWQALGVYGEVLPAMGVPAVHTGGGNLLAMRAVKDGVTLLRALAGPDDDVAMAALLRGPYFAVDDVTLYRFAAQRADSEPGPDGGDRRLGLWEALVALPDPQPALARAREVIAALLSLRASRPPSALLAAADALTGFTAVQAGLPGGRRRLADYAGLLDLVRRLEAGSGDVFTVWRRLRLLLAAELEVARPKLAAAGAVTLLTIHGSKGLEWPVVAVADLDRKSPTERQPVLIDPGLGVALRLEDEEGAAVEPALYRILRGRAAEQEEREARRLLYVALTRARDHLILSAAAERGGALDVLEPGLRAAGVPRLVVAHDPERATYPSLGATVATGPSPAGAGSDQRLLVRFDSGPNDGGRHERLPGPGLPGETAATAAWSGVLDLVATLDDAWSAVAEALAAAGVRAPDAELAGRWLKSASAGDGPGAYLLLAWRVPGGVMALIDPAAVASGDVRRSGEPAPSRLDADPAAAAAALDMGIMTIGRRPHGADARDRVERVWLIPIDPLSAVDVSVERVLLTLPAGGDRGAP